MNWSVKIFRVKGIDIKLHLTFILILVWAAYHWSGVTNAGLEGALFGVIATLLLFVSVTLHELGHSLVALKHGVRVQDITLMPMGGLARMEEIPEEPKREFSIALAGPLVNFALAAALYLLSTSLGWGSSFSLSGLSQSMSQVSAKSLLIYLTTANFTLGVFNLVPAYPMDGGRILRALMALRMDHGRATAIAVKIGQGLAFLIGLWGFTTGSFTLVLIAIFIWMGAGSEGEQSQVKEALRGVTVARAMSSNPETVRANDSLARAIELTLTSLQADFPVVHARHGGLVGFLSENDLLTGLKDHGQHAPVSSVMRTGYPSARVDEPLYQAQQRMAQDKVRAMPVLDHAGRLVGLLTAMDINEAYRLLSIQPGLVGSRA
jgi:Zn-dependent protease/CBS domain-containing protein